MASKLESVQLWTPPCGCSVHMATAETRVPSNRPGEQHRDTHPDGKEREFHYVTWAEAEQIRLTKFNHPFWGPRTNPNPNPPARHCAKHSHHGHSAAWYATLMAERTDPRQR